MDADPSMELSVTLPCSGRAWYMTVWTALDSSRKRGRMRSNTMLSRNAPVGLCVGEYNALVVTLLYEVVVYNVNLSQEMSCACTRH